MEYHLDKYYQWLLCGAVKYEDTSNVTICPLTSGQGPPSLVLISLRRESSAPSAKRATIHLIATEADRRPVVNSGV